MAKRTLLVCPRCSKEGNVQWVCVKYNLMKAHATQEEFIEMCKKVVEKSNA
jgi:hypothetical protein